MKNIEQLFTLAIKNNIINTNIKDNLMNLVEKEFPYSDLYKEKILEKSIEKINKKDENSKRDNILNEVMTFGEAQEIFNLGPSTLRRNVDYKRYKEGETRQSKGTWIITLNAIKRLYPKQYYAKIEEYFAKMGGENVD